MDSHNTSRLIMKLLADEKENIPYRPKLARLIDSVTATILLQQINYWWMSESGNRKACTPFYKFRRPCPHPLYKAGDSWSEELGLSPGEFDTALKRIGTKIKPKDSKQAVLNVVEVELDADGKMSNTNKLVMYWTGQDHVTHFELNEQLFFSLLHHVFKEVPNSQIPNSGSPNQEKPNSGNPNFQFGKPELANSGNPNPIEQRLPETTTENTEREEAPAQTFSFSGKGLQTDLDKDPEIINLKALWEQNLDLPPPTSKWFYGRLAECGKFGVKRLKIAIRKAGMMADPPSNSKYIAAVAKNLSFQEVEAHDDNGYPINRPQADRRAALRPVGGSGTSPARTGPPASKLRPGYTDEERAAIFAKYGG